MSIATQAWAADIATVAAAVVAVAAAGALLVKLGKTRVGRLFGRTWRRAVVDPLAAWMHATVVAAVQPQLEVLSARNDHQHAENAARQDETNRRLDGVEHRLEAVEAKVDLIIITNDGGLT